MYVLWSYDISSLRSVSIIQFSLTFRISLFMKSYSTIRLECVQSSHFVKKILTYLNTCITNIQLRPVNISNPCFPYLPVHAGRQYFFFLLCVWFSNMTELTGLHNGDLKMLEHKGNGGIHEESPKNPDIVKWEYWDARFLPNESNEILEICQTRCPKIKTQY